MQSSAPSKSRQKKSVYNLMYTNKVSLLNNIIIIQYNYNIIVWKRELTYKTEYKPM